MFISRLVVSVAALFGVGSLGFGWTALRRQDQAAGEAVQVGLIQPSIEQTLKWDPAYHARILDTYEALTREAAKSRPAVILWPETATTMRSGRYHVSRYEANVSRVALSIVSRVPRMSQPSGWSAYSSRS